MSDRRFRLFFRPPHLTPNGQNVHDNCWRRLNDEFADAPDEAVRRAAGKSSNPTDGTWLALAEGTHLWDEFHVRSRTALEVESTDPKPEALAAQGR